MNRVEIISEISGEIDNIFTDRKIDNIIDIMLALTTNAVGHFYERNMADASVQRLMMGFAKETIAKYHEMMKQKEKLDRISKASENDTTEQSYDRLKKEGML